MSYSRSSVPGKACARYGRHLCAVPNPNAGDSLSLPASRTLIRSRIANTCMAGWPGSSRESSQDNRLLKPPSSRCLLTTRDFVAIPSGCCSAKCRQWWTWFAVRLEVVATLPSSETATAKANTRQWVETLCAPPTDRSHDLVPQTVAKLPFLAGTLRRSPI